MEHKYEIIVDNAATPIATKRKRGSWSLQGIVLPFITATTLLLWGAREIVQWNGVIIADCNGSEIEASVRPVAQVVRRYNITVGVKWLNLDGGRWRPGFVCNGESPCPTLNAREGDQIELHTTNDLPTQLSIHWSGMTHQRFGFENDGTGGLNQWAMLPRSNWTSHFDTTGHWGLNWYADHTGAGVADGVYGTVWTAPSPSRPRPYTLIAGSPVDVRLIQEAEDDIQHMVLWNSDFRTADWKIQKMKAKGTGLSCYKSILVNGKGRVFCKNPSYSTIDGHELDDAGCVVTPGIEPDACTPSLADLTVIETHGKEYIMLNLINVGFEHALKWSVDNHRVWVVANDAGFIEPQLVDTVYITNGARVTVLVKLDQDPNDYAIRLASTSKLQNLEGYALLRYPAKRYPIYGQPMALPSTSANTKICLNPDSSVPHGCHEFDEYTARPFPAQIPDKTSNKTLLWTAGSQPSKYEQHVTEYYVNEKPWQLFRAAMEPVYFTKDAASVAKPIQAGLPIGTVVDLIVQNTLNETIPLYKHGNPTFHLGSRAFEKFEWNSIQDALEHHADVNINDPALAVVHDLPPLGWLAIRWRVTLTGATMFHAVKLRYFALGMAAPMLEGIETSVRASVSEYAKHQPHVMFEPGNDGVFG
ncbi:conidial pigment biosynthesis oxidase arb2 brown2 like protein [Zymoseptoria brevis]|uniref:Conidial pigment biosynthesis oxidase arb2 brown2 like protein n=1 Tax=Zymoseptoria brevis TaxID=1047168 RepID=A0A0F4G9D5_9PEZI|nr:conidial pigment biosynthesis oxidase arb2 brown2 like protein [Zymoseptoria brevis]